MTSRVFFLHVSIPRPQPRRGVVEIHNAGRGTADFVELVAEVARRVETLRTKTDRQSGRH